MWMLAQVLCVHKNCAWQERMNECDEIPLQQCMSLTRKYQPQPHFARSNTIVILQTLALPAAVEILAFEVILISAEKRNVAEGRVPLMRITASNVRH